MSGEHASPSSVREQMFIRDEQGRWLILSGPPWRRRAFVTPSREWRDTAGEKLRARFVISLGAVGGLGPILRSAVADSGHTDLVATLLSAVAMGIGMALLFHFWAVRSVLRGLEPAPMPPRDRLREWNRRRMQVTPAWLLWTGIVLMVPLLVASLWMLALGIDLARFWPLGAESAGRIAAGFPATSFVFGGIVATLGAVVGIGAMGYQLVMRSRADGRRQRNRPLSTP